MDFFSFLTNSNFLTMIFTPSFFFTHCDCCQKSKIQRIIRFTERYLERSSVKVHQRWWISLSSVSFTIFISIRLYRDCESNYRQDDSNDFHYFTTNFQDFFQWFSNTRGWISSKEKGTKRVTARSSLRERLAGCETVTLEFPVGGINWTSIWTKLFTLRLITLMATSLL